MYIINNFLAATVQKKKNSFLLLLFGGVKSLKSGMYFTFAVHSNLDQSHFKDSIATLDIGPKNSLKAEPTLFTGGWTILFGS